MKIYDFAIERVKGEALVRCVEPYDEQKIRKGDLLPREPFYLELSEGELFSDVLGYQDTCNFAISERLYDLLVEHEILGWRGYEVNIKDRIEKYYGFQVLGRCDKIITPDEPGFYVGYKFNHETWDGSDFFSPDESMLLFCTEKVRGLLADNGITNAELVDIDKVEGYSFGSE